MRRWNALLRVAFVVVVAGCGGDPDVEIAVVGPTPSREDSTALQAPPVASHNDVELWPCDVYTNSVEEEFALQLSGDVALAREVHDCQRLIVDGEYGPLVAVFPYAPSMDLPTDSFAVWRQVATLYNWGWEDLRNEPYYPLGIGRGLSCLFLRKAGNVWQATLVRELFGRGCIPGPGFAPLVVLVQRYTGAPVSGMATYPATGRFRWHPRAQQYAIGIKCGNAWCTVGRQSAVVGLTASLQGPLMRTVPGYFDEQPLAVYDSVRDTLLVGPIGRIYPSASLQPANAKGADLRIWDTMDGYAEFEVERGSGDVTLFEAYVEKLGLGLTPDGRTAQATVFVTAPTGLGSTPAAETRVNGVTSKPADRVELVLNRRHSAEGTVRWRWLEEDEAAWLPCQQDNCCTGVWNR